MTYLKCALAAWLLASPALLAQAPEPAPVRFEVTSIKPNTQVSPFASTSSFPGGRFVASNMPLAQLILIAYQIQPAQLVDAPDWLRTERFDIEARSPEPFPLYVPSGQPNPLHAMLRALLAERFGLVVRMETQRLPALVLMAASSGESRPRIQRSAVDCAAAAAANGGQLPGTRTGERPVCGIAPGFGRMFGGGATIAELANLLAPQLRRVVLDRTSLAGRFDFDLQWTPDNLPPRPAGAPPDQPIRVNGIDIDPNGPSLETALREQLGIRMTSMSAEVPVLVVVSVERPTPN